MNMALEQLLTTRATMDSYGKELNEAQATEGIKEAKVSHAAKVKEAKVHHATTIKEAKAQHTTTIKEAKLHHTTQIMEAKV